MCKVHQISDLLSPRNFKEEVLVLGMLCSISSKYSRLNVCLWYVLSLPTDASYQNPVSWQWQTKFISDGKFFHTDNEKELPHMCVVYIIFFLCIIILPEWVLGNKAREELESIVTVVQTFHYVSMSCRTGLAAPPPSTVGQQTINGIKQKPFCSR